MNLTKANLIGEKLKSLLEGESIMAGGQLGVILKMAQTINSEIKSDRQFEIDLEKFRQLPVGTLGCKRGGFFGRSRVGADRPVRRDWC
ncbi:hypothetical protein QT972_29505 [Microcoleus sp. herbarium7]|uniref:hypothetical protein n=1 Tax=Microcoleus sp. herbarium7 TaxID=3055435 RepID=UPI002FCF8473